MANGLEQTKEKFQPASTGELQNNSLNRFHILSSFLRQKSYAFYLSADKSRQVENREFFERQVSDGTRYAGNFGFRNQRFPAALSLSRSAKTIDRVSRPSEDSEDTEIDFNISNESKGLGETHFGATYDDFSRTESGTPNQEGTSQDLHLTHRKIFQAASKKTLYSSFRFFDLTGTSDSSVWNVTENLNVEHTDSLSSTYNYNFSNRVSSGAKTKNHQLLATLRHQLYRSLTSTLGSTFSASDAETFTQNDYGLTWDEDYVKRLGKIGRFSAGAGLAYAEEERKAPGGVLSIIDESRVLTTGTTTLLEKPRVNTATVVVTNSAGTATFTSGVDFQLSSVGERTQIQRLTNGGITNGQEVLVDYQAQTSPAFQFNTLGQRFHARMDFLGEALGVFYRLSKTRHPQVSGEENALLETLTDTTVGCDLHWKNLFVALENEDYDSNLSPYQQWKLKETLVFHPLRKSTLALQSSQSKLKLIRTQESQRLFDFISRFSLGLNRHTNVFAEGGYRRQKGAGMDLNGWVASSGLEFKLDKLLFELTYDFRKESNVGDNLANHFFSTRVKRRF